MKILIVTEDSNLFTDIENTLIDADQATLVHCASINKFNDEIDAEDYALILSELEFFDGDISELINISNSKNSNIPFVLIINDHEESQALELLDFGARDYLFRNNLAKLKSITRHSINDFKHKEQLNLSKSYDELLSIEKINAALFGGKSMEQITKLILDGLYEVNGVDRSRIYLYDDENNQLSLLAQRISSNLNKRIEDIVGVKINTVCPLLIEGTYFQKSVSNNENIITHDKNILLKIIAEHTENKVLKKLAKLTSQIARIKTFGILPISSNGRVFGVLTIATHVELRDSQKQSILRFVQFASMVLSKLQSDSLLKKNKENFEAISNYTANFETWLDIDGKPIWVNPGVFELIGYTSEELLALPNFYLEIIHIDDLEIVMTTLQDALLNKTNGDNFEFKCNHKNGTFPWFSVSWKQVYNSENEWIGIRTSGIDITEKKEQEIELKKRDLQISETEKIAGIGTWKWNPKTDELFINERMERILELPFNHSLKKFRDLLPLLQIDSQIKIKNLAHRALQEQFEGDSEIKLTTISPKEKHLLLRVADKRQLKDTDYLIIGTAVDITELTNSFKQLEESQNRFKKIFESIQDVYYQTCLDGKIMLISPSVKTILGYDAIELIDSPIESLYINPKVRRKKIKSLIEFHTPLNFETYFKTKKGKEIFVSISLSITEDKDGKQVIQGLLRDVSEKKKQELRLENQRKRLLEIVQLNTRIIETSDQFFYVLEVKKNQLGFNNPLKYISPQVNRIVGVGEIELLKSDSRWYSYIHPDDRRLVKDKLQALLITKQPVEVIYRIQNQKTKKYVWVNDYSCLQVDVNENRYEVYGAIKDITDKQRVIEKIEKEKQQSAAFQYQLLGSQLNPHFIYNTLNSFQYYILKGDIEASLNHIAEFSTLMRTVLENSMHHRISLEDEISFLEQYVQISKQRMKQPLDFELIVDENIELSEQFIPPMLLQPYIENSIIHGFANSKKACKLTLKFEIQNDYIHCIIRDNGVGRATSKKLNEVTPNKSKKSFAMGINQSRINLLNQITNNQFEVEIIDLYDDYKVAEGTEVILKYYQITSEFVFTNT